MSKLNILELHKNLNTYAKGALEQAGQVADSAKNQLKDVRRLEEELLGRIRRRDEAQRVWQSPARRQNPWQRQSRKLPRRRLPPAFWFNGRKSQLQSKNQLLPSKK